LRADDGQLGSNPNTPTIFCADHRIVVVNRWDEKAGLRRDAVRSQVIDVLEAQKIKETGNEEG
jgi:hypothetical protein